MNTDKSHRVMRPPLWACPRCRRVFANRNQSHACGRHHIASHFHGKPPEIRALYRAFRSRLREIGPVRVNPEKSRIAFQVRMNFAVVMPKRHWIDGHLILARRVDDVRFTRVQTFSPRNHLHAFRLRHVSDIDDGFLALLRESYLVGEQKHLR